MTLVLGLAVVLGLAIVGRQIVRSRQRRRLMARVSPAWLNAHAYDKAGDQRW